MLEYAKIWVKEAYHSLVIANQLPVEPYKIYVKEGYDTAFWSYDPPHNIILGTDIFKHIKNKKINSSQMEEYFMSYFYHEIGHSKYTDKDVKTVIETLKNKKIPFSLFNIFEDARIEEKMRQFLNKDFKWSLYIPLEIPEQPLDLFFYFLHHENKPEKIRLIYSQLPDRLKLEFKKIYGFYQDTLTAPSTQALIPIVEKWKQAYRVPPEKPSSYHSYIRERKISIDYPNDRLFGGENQIMQDPSIKEEILQGAELALSFNETDDALERAAKKHFASVDKLSNANLLLKRARRVHIDKKERELLERTIARLFQRERKYRTPDYIPAKRIDVRRLVLGHEKFYKKTHTKLEIHKKTITVILDMSGSMSDVVDRMLLLVLVVNSLAKKGFVDGHLVLSAMGDHDTAICQTFSFPLDEDIIYKLDPRFGGEGLAETMKFTLETMKKSDFVWVYTDGFLTDDPIDKEFFHKHGIYTYGIYLGNGYDANSDLKKWFDYIICRNNVQDLARDLMKLIKK